MHIWSWSNNIIIIIISCFFLCVCVSNFDIVKLYIFLSFKKKDNNPDHFSNEKILKLISYNTCFILQSVFCHLLYTTVATIIFLFMFIVINIIITWLLTTNEHIIVCRCIYIDKNIIERKKKLHLVRSDWKKNQSKRPKKIFYFIFH